MSNFNIGDRVLCNSPVSMLGNHMPAGVVWVVDNDISEEFWGGICLHAPDHPDGELTGSGARIAKAEWLTPAPAPFKEGDKVRAKPGALVPDRNLVVEAGSLGVCEDADEDDILVQFDRGSTKEIGNDQWWMRAKDLELVPAPITDMRGKPVVAGSTIAVGTREHNHAELRLYTVVSATSGQLVCSPNNKPGSKRTYKFSAWDLAKRIVVLV